MYHQVKCFSCSIYTENVKEELLKVTQCVLASSTEKWHYLLFLVLLELVIVLPLPCELRKAFQGLENVIIQWIFLSPAEVLDIFTKVQYIVSFSPIIPTVFTIMMIITTQLFSSTDIALSFAVKLYCKMKLMTILLLVLVKPWKRYEIDFLENV